VSCESCDLQSCKNITTFVIAFCHQQCINLMFIYPIATIFQKHAPVIMYALKFCFFCIEILLANHSNIIVIAKVFVLNCNFACCFFYHLKLLTLSSLVKFAR